MSTFSFCFNGRCIDIPIDWLGIFGGITPPGPVEVKRPHPEPWLKGVGINSDAVRDLAQVAAIYQLTGSIVDEKVRGVFVDSVKSAAANLDLPSDMELRIDEEVVRSLFKPS